MIGRSPVLTKKGNGMWFKRKQPSTNGLTFLPVPRESVFWSILLQWKRNDRPWISVIPFYWQVERLAKKIGSLDWFPGSSFESILSVRIIWFRHVFILVFRVDNCNPQIHLDILFCFLHSTIPLFTLSQEDIQKQFSVRHWFCKAILINFLIFRGGSTLFLIISYTASSIVWATTLCRFFSLVVSTAWERFLRLTLQSWILIGLGTLMRRVFLQTKSVTIACFLIHLSFSSLFFSLSFSFITVFWEFLGLKKPAIWRLFT